MTRTTSAPSVQPRPLFTTRQGLPRVAVKLAQGKPITIAYFGGSITQADGYRVMTTARLRERFPKSTITEINAGVGGTGSDLGAHRLAQDVIRHKPDFVFVEFAVNDGNESHDVAAAVEGIVRHILREIPDCDIAFVYTLTQSNLAEHMADRLPPASRLHEPVAEHYGLPSIDVALDAARRLHVGELKWEDFSSDMCHPLPAGHALYANVIAAALAECFAVKPPVAPPAVPRPRHAQPWEHANMLTVDPQRHRFQGWSYRPLVNRGGWECFDGVLESDSSDESHIATFDFDGTAVGLYYFLGPDSGNVTWSIDNGPWQETKLWDRFAEQFQRPSYQTLVANLKPGRHQLRVRVAPQQEPKSKGKWLRIAHLLTR